jgi:hypothetical protein
MAGIDYLIEPFESRGRDEKPTNAHELPRCRTTGEATLGALDWWMGRDAAAGTRAERWPESGVQSGVQSERNWEVRRHTRMALESQIAPT